MDIALHVIMLLNEIQHELNISNGIEKILYYFFFYVFEYYTNSTVTFFLKILYTYVKHSQIELSSCSRYFCVVRILSTLL